MKLTLTIASLAALLALPVMADEAAKTQAADAVKKLAGSSYSWTSTTALPEGAGNNFRGGPVEGKVDSTGLMHVTYSMGDNKTQSAKKGTATVSTNREGAWQTEAEREAARAARGGGNGGGNGGNGGAGGGRTGRRGGMMGNFLKSPTERATELIGQVADLTKEGDTLSGVLTDEGAKAAFGFPIKEIKGSVKFTLKEGSLAKMELKLEGKAEFNGEERDMSRTTTTEIKEVGTTKVELPEEATKKLAAAATEAKPEEKKDEAKKEEPKKEEPKKEEPKKEEKGA